MYLRALDVHDVTIGHFGGPPTSQVADSDEVVQLSCNDFHRKVLVVLLVLGHGFGDILGPLIEEE